MSKSANDIKPLTIPWLFQDLRLEKKTGTAVFERDGTIKKVFFSQGDVLFAASNRNEDRLGEFLVRRGKITPEQFAKATEGVIKTGKKLGAVLFGMRALSAKDLVDQVKLQVREIVLDLFSWRDGTYAFSAGVIPLAEVIPLQMSTGDLIIDGLRDRNATDARAALPPLSTVLRPAADHELLFQRAHLDADQREVLALINGERSIAGLTALSDLPEDTVLDAVSVLLALRMAEPGTVTAPEDKEFLREAFPGKGTEASVDVAITKTRVQSDFERMATLSHYEMLGIAKNASDAEIKKAYLVAAKRYHPDRHFEPEMSDMKEKLEALFARSHEAYETLKSPVNRAQYDRRQAAQAGATPAASPPDPKVMAVARYREGMTQMNIGNYWAADESFDWAERLDPGNGEYVFQRGIALSHMPRRGRDAEDYLKRAVDMEPRKPEFRLGLGRFYLRTGRKSLAASTLRDALDLAPDSTEIQQALVEATG